MARRHGKVRARAEARGREREPAPACSGSQRRRGVSWRRLWRRGGECGTVATGALWRATVSRRTARGGATALLLLLLFHIAYAQHAVQRGGLPAVVSWDALTWRGADGEYPAAPV